MRRLLSTFVGGPLDGQLVAGYLPHPTRRHNPIVLPATLPEDEADGDVLAWRYVRYVRDTLAIGEHRLDVYVADGHDRPEDPATTVIVRLIEAGTLDPTEAHPDPEPTTQPKDPR